MVFVNALAFPHRTFLIFLPAHPQNFQEYIAKAPQANSETNLECFREAQEPNFLSRIGSETKLYVSLTKLFKQNSQMTKETFGEYIRRLREERNLPLRKVAAQLDVDTSTLSKVERGERPISINYLKPLSQILKTDCKELQVRFLVDSINANYGKLEYLEDGLGEVINQLKKNKK